MKAHFLLALTVASALVAGCGGGSSSSPATNATTNASSPLAQPEIFAQKKTDVAALTQAVQQYNATEGHYPKDLSELAPNYIAKVPEVPAGYKLNYDSNNGTVTLVQQ
jgi:ABC-type glycerol-3-phosphate transport system substrate-binding protein